MQNELQTALFQAFDTLNLQRVKTFSVPPVTLCGPGSVSSCGQQAQTRGLKHLFVMADSFLHQAGMTAGLTRSLAVKGIAMTLWPCPVGEPCITDVCAAVAQLRESGCDGVIAFGGGSVLDAAKAVALLVTNPDSTLAEMSETSVLQPRLPLIAYEDDCVTRLIQDDVNETAYNQIKNWSISELREYVLSDETSVDDIAFTRKGLTSEVVAAVAKICSNADLIYGAKKMPVIKKANTTIGIPGTFSARLQPNDTRDDVQSIAAQIYEGLSFGVGDAVIGVNPVTDDVENLSRVLDTIYGVIDKFNIPTQGCVLAHVTTQIEAIRRGAPGGLIFQSICGSEKGLKEFGVELAMLDEARAVGAEFNRIAGENCLYFETGQGSALSAGANFGADQVTMEARNYGLARHYDPFIVNTVVGFIGPEYLYNDRQIIRAGLEDHFMGKLSGISMGCDCCYTNHADA
ncbi:TPA: iron-containing alcohol dehydrogenase, partial [Shigella flexneri]|nr:iron-containing alcohol dehydrogenase [Shigella flexneri]